MGLLRQISLLSQTTLFHNFDEDDLLKKVCYGFFAEHKCTYLKKDMNMYYTPNKSFAADTAAYVATQLNWPPDGR